MAAKRLELRRADRCANCGIELAAGVLASWDRGTRSVTCLPCLDRTGGVASPAAITEPPVVDGDQAGASLARQYEQRRANRERRVREAHPHIGGLLLALNGEPQHQKAFSAGEQGELEVAAAIERAVATVDGTVLHNRRMPGGRGDIDHIAIVPSGIYVIDAKAVTGKVETRSHWSKPPLLLIAGRDRTHYLDGLDRQLEAVRNTLPAADHDSISLQGALCFTKADLPLHRTVEMRDHLLIYRKALTQRLTASGPVDPARSAEVAAMLNLALRPA